MEIREMQIGDIEARFAEIDAELENKDADRAALKAEVEQLNERKAELRKLAEERKAEAAKATSEGEVVKTFKEEREMEKTFKPDTTEYRDAYLKNLMGLPMEMEERTALTNAASVIPTETLNKIYGKLEENPLIGELDALRIPGYVSVPVATTVNDASWLPIGSASTDSADVVGYIALSAKKLIKTIEITADIRAMSIPAFQDWLVNKLAQKMEAAICAAVVNGAGSATVPEGIGQGGILASTAITASTVEAFAGLMADVGTAYHRSAVWIMSPSTFFEKVLPMANDVNGVVVMNGLDYRLLGHRVILDNNTDSTTFKNGSTAETVSANHVIFGSLRDGYVFNYGEGIAIEADQSVAFRSGSTVYRAMALCDGAVVDKEAFAWAKIS